MRKRKDFILGDAGRFAVLALTLLLISSCTGGGGQGEPQASPSGVGELVAQVASYDIAVGRQRFIVGLLTQDQDLVGHGSVNLRFGHLGTESEGKATLGPAVKANFLAIPDEATGPPPPIKDSPEIVRESSLRGVYSTEASFDKPGFWGVQVIAKLKGQPEKTARATFEVLPRHEVPWIGEDAPRTDNLTMASSDAPRAAIDSRATEGGEIPDANLHEMTVAGAIAQKKPALVVIATPVFCVSRFCGPITDMVSSLSQTYGNKAAFIHIEVWRDFGNKELNKGAAEWILKGQDAQEPWVFLIGADGKIAARWDNVATRQEIEPLLQGLPPLA